MSAELFAFMGSDWGLATAFLFLIGGFGWHFYQCWVNRASQWTLIGTRRGIQYLQHKKYPSRRIWRQLPVHGNLDVKWINHKSDILTIE